MFIFKCCNFQGIHTYVFCPACNLAWPGWDFDSAHHPNHGGEPIAFPGIYIQVKLGL